MTHNNGKHRPASRLELEARGDWWRRRLAQGCAILAGWLVLLGVLAAGSALESWIGGAP